MSRRTSDRPSAGTGWLLLSPALATVAFFVVAMVLLLNFSLHEQERGVPVGGLTIRSYVDALSTPYSLGVIGTTAMVSVMTTALCVLLGLPIALAIHRTTSKFLRGLVYFALFVPLLTSVVVRSYGWKLLLSDNGLINSVLLGTGIIDQPIRLLYDTPGVVISLVHIFLPFMVFPIVGVLNQVDRSWELAAADLGARGMQAFGRIVLPLIVPGLLVGCEIVLALSIGAFATPALLGGGRVQVMATQIYSDIGDLEWGRSATGAYLLLAMALVIIFLFSRIVPRQTRKGLGL